jgi:hypothetical protein
LSKGYKVKDWGERCQLEECLIRAAANADETRVKQRTLIPSSVFIFGLAPSAENIRRECVEDITKKNTKCFEIWRYSTAEICRDIRVEEGPHLIRLIMYQYLRFNINVFVLHFEGKDKRRVEEYRRGKVKPEVKWYLLYYGGGGGGGGFARIEKIVGKRPVLAPSSLTKLL